MKRTARKLLIAWAGSYAEGFFWLKVSRGAGIHYITVQRGICAFNLDFPARHDIPAGQYFWWLEPTDMFDNQVQEPSGDNAVRLPDNGSIVIEIASTQYPWRWRSGPDFEGYIPLWWLVISFAIVPVGWTLGWFDIKRPTLTEPKK